MANAVVFRGAYIRSFTMKNGTDGRGIRVEVTADWTDKVREHMEWEEISHGVGACDLTGRLAANVVTLTPSKNDLKQHALEFEASEVGGFALIPQLDKEGEVTGRELRFTIKTAQLDAAKKIERYVQTLGREAAQMRVSYEKQENLPGTEPVAESAE